MNDKTQEIPSGVPVNVMKAYWKLEGFGFSLGGEHGHSYDCLMHPLLEALINPSDEMVNVGDFYHEKA